MKNALPDPVVERIVESNGHYYSPWIVRKPGMVCKIINCVHDFFFCQQLIKKLRLDMEICVDDKLSCETVSRHLNLLLKSGELLEYKGPYFSPAMVLGTILMISYNLFLFISWSFFSKLIVKMEGQKNSFGPATWKTSLRVRLARSEWSAGFCFSS